MVYFPLEYQRTISTIWDIYYKTYNIYSILWGDILKMFNVHSENIFKFVYRYCEYNIYLGKP